MNAPPGHDADRWHRRSALAGIAAGVLVVALLLGVLVYLDVHEQVVDLLQWVEAQGAWAALFFVLLMAAVVVLLLPGVLLTTGAGFVFGVVAGSIYVVIGTTLGALLAFLLARYTFGQRARAYVMSHARLHVVSEELAGEGWKIVLLTRMIPFFPSKIANYVFGLTSFSLRGYVGGSLLGFIPYSVNSVYLGSLAADVATAGARHAERSAAAWMLYGAGFIVSVIAVIYCSRLARRALARYAAAGAIEGELP